MSANSAVTVFRSPSVIGRAVGSAENAIPAVSNVDRCAAALPSASAVPQSPQNRLLGGFSAPLFGHLLANGVPQSPQNFLPAGLSLPHFVQRIPHLSVPMDWSLSLLPF